MGNLPVGTYLRQGPFAPPSFPSEPIYPNTGLITDSVNAFKPDLKIGKIHSWTFSIQRELSLNTVLEVRYIGNRGRDLWRQYDLNELNISENGVFAEWKIAQRNLLANIAANRCQPGLTHIRNAPASAGTFTAGCQANFAYFGEGTGTSPLPITLGYFQGLSGAAVNNPANYTNANFRSSTYYNTMNPLNPNPLTIRQQLVEYSHLTTAEPERARSSRLIISWLMRVNAVVLSSWITPAKASTTPPQSSFADGFRGVCWFRRATRLVRLLTTPTPVVLLCSINRHSERFRSQKRRCAIRYHPQR